MHVIAKEAFDRAMRQYPNDKTALLATCRGLKEGDFPTPDSLKSVFSSLDNFRYRPKWWVMNVGGNNLRLIAYINFVNKRVYVKHIVTHALYDQLNKHYRTYTK
ncbi:MULTISPECIES: type II toxin-antitoxin system HigB family toxin [Rahnella]|uniref:type II toxin-antitoxin system HigB family toxin n=1 Tax=Rahnella TaxID=34037 RepID=UPI001043C5C6|nr:MULTISPECIES: type II toxin-antitoxin system HigB family toxin [Rahnella]TCQ89450.1 mRNA interferase HigB [Rahnella sp. JUb53]